MSQPEGNAAQELHVRRDLLLRQALDDRISALIKTAAERVKLLEGNKEMSESQLRNVLNVAAETRSVDVVTNFIRYQIGRLDKAWGPRDFGKRIIQDIEEGIVAQCAEKVNQMVREHLGASASEGVEDAYIWLTRRYLGYLERCFYYCSKSNDWKGVFRTKEVGNGAV